MLWEQCLTLNEQRINEYFLNEYHRLLPRYTKFNVGQKKHAHVSPTNKPCLTLCPDSHSDCQALYALASSFLSSVSILHEHHVSSLLEQFPFCSQKGNCFFTPLSLCPFCSLCLELSPTPFLHFLHLVPSWISTHPSKPSSSVTSSVLLLPQPIRARHSPDPNNLAHITYNVYHGVFFLFNGSVIDIKYHRVL